MEEVQKNENGTTVPQADGKPKKEDKPNGNLPRNRCSSAGK